VERVRGWVRVVSDRAAKQVGRLGLDIQKEPRFRDSIAVVDGQLDPLSESGTILLFEKQAKKLDVRLGDMVTLYAQTARGVVNTIDCRVVAIAREMGLLSKFNAYVSHETLRTLFQVRPDVTGVIQVYLPDALVDEANELSSRVRDALELAGHRVMDRDPRPFWMKLQDTVREDWAGQKLDVSTWSEELSFMTWSVELLSALKTALMIVLVTIIVIGVSNALWVSIRERTREIGTLRALGMKRHGVMRLFMMESALLGLIAGLAGALLGLAIAVAMNRCQIQLSDRAQIVLMSQHLRLAPSAGLALEAVGLMTIVCALAGLGPARRAARISPVLAMAHAD